MNFLLFLDFLFLYVKVVDTLFELSLDFISKLDRVLHVTVKSMRAMVDDNFWGTLEDDADFIISLLYSCYSQLGFAVWVEGDHAFDL